MNCLLSRGRSSAAQTHWTASWTLRKFHEVGKNQHQHDIIESLLLEKISKIIKLPKYTGRSNLCTAKNSFLRAAKLSYCSSCRIHEDKNLFKIWKKKGTPLSHWYNKHNSVGNPANPQCTQFSALVKLKVRASALLCHSRKANTVYSWILPSSTSRIFCHPKKRATVNLANIYK